MGTCSALNCDNNDRKGKRKRRLFKFPADPHRRAKWVENMRPDNNCEVKSSSRLCEIHFEESQYESKRQDGWKKLKPNAVPTIFNTVPEVPDSQSSCSVDHNIDPTSVEHVPNKLQKISVNEFVAHVKQEEWEVVKKLKSSAVATLSNDSNKEPESQNSISYNIEFVNVKPEPDSDDELQVSNNSLTDVPNPPISNRQIYLKHEDEEVLNNIIVSEPEVKEKIKHLENEVNMWKEKYTETVQLLKRAKIDQFAKITELQEENRRLKKMNESILSFFNQDQIKKVEQGES